MLNFTSKYAKSGQTFGVTEEINCLSFGLFTCVPRRHKFFNKLLEQCKRDAHKKVWIYKWFQCVYYYCVIYCKIYFMVLNFSSMTFSLKLIYKKEKFDTYNTYIQKGFRIPKSQSHFATQIKIIREKIYDFNYSLFTSKLMQRYVFSSRSKHYF